MVGLYSNVIILGKCYQWGIAIGGKDEKVEDCLNSQKEDAMVPHLQDLDCVWVKRYSFFQEGALKQTRK